MDWKQLLFKILTKTLALPITLVSIYWTYHHGETIKPLDSDTCDYYQHEFTMFD